MTHHRDHHAVHVDSPSNRHDEQITPQAHPTVTAPLRTAPQAQRTTPTVFLPDSRSMRPQGNPYVPYEPSESQRGQFDELERNPQWLHMLSILRTYVHETIPMPGDTVGFQWSIIARPHVENRHQPRYVTLMCENVETLVILQGTHGASAYVNVKRPDSDRGLPFGLVARRYPGIEDVRLRSFRSLGALEKSLSDTRFLDWCYRLNAELLRAGGTAFRNTCNPLLADAVINGTDARQAAASSATVEADPQTSRQSHDRTCDAHGAHHEAAL